MSEDGNSTYTWQTYDDGCQLKPLLSQYLGAQGQEEAVDEISMLFVGDSVDRSTLWDVNSTAQESGLQVHTLVEEHWRTAFTMPNLEMVYQFSPGSHMVGPYHDDVHWNKTITNAVPRAFEMHRLLTGREEPSMVVFSNILWDLGRWLFLSEIAEPDRMDHFGKPLLRDQEYLPAELLEEFRLDTEVQMQRMQSRVSADSVLVYHNAAFALLLNCSNGTDHMRKGMGKRTHLAQLNALTRQIVADNTRWQLVDLGHMSETFLHGGHLRDEHHPSQNFMLEVMNVYLNLYREHGSKAVRRRAHLVGDMRRWDDEYLSQAETLQAEYLMEANATESRVIAKREAEQFRLRRVDEYKRRPPLHKKLKMLFNFKMGL